MNIYAAMRRAFLLLVAFSLAAGVYAKSPKYYLSVGDLPDGSKVIPAPPADGTARKDYDEAQYQWGKSIRETPRGHMAVADAELGEGWFCQVFSEPFGYEISKDTTPELYKLLKAVELDAGSYSVRKAKQHFKRTRPFMDHGEPTSTPHQEEGMRTNYSYPSGHTARGWALALVLAELNPDRQEEILNRGFEYGQSRVIVGAHWQSDVDMARVMSSAGVARLHADRRFGEQLLKAKTELDALKGVCPECCGCCR